MTEEHKKKISFALKGKNTWSKGRKLSDETRKKIGLGGIGRTYSDERNKKVAIANLGKKATEEARRNMSLAHIGKKATDEQKRKISQSLKANYKAHFDSHQGYKRKPYTMPDGKVIQVQGYETLTLNYLIYTGSIDPSRIMTETKDKPMIPYEFSGSHNYFPDAYLPASKTIIETKSVYTLNADKEKNKAKILASLNAGYDCRVIVWNGKHTLVKDHTFMADLIK